VPIGELILHCYRLAQYYGLNPRTFLEMPLSEVRRHMYWTDYLVERTNAEQASLDG
jgi:hypothetical protein